MPPNIKVAGLGSIPQGYILGRQSPGVGDVELIASPDLVRGGNVGGGSSLPLIANNSLLANTSGVLAQPIQTLFSVITGIGSALKWTTARLLSFTGDVTGSGSVDGSANVATALTLAATAVTPGSYGDASHVGAFTVDSKGRLTAASNVAISGGGGGGAYLPLVTGAEPPVLVSDGAGHLLTIPYTP